MNILYCMDEKSNDYSRYMGVSILSLLENNKNEDIYIYILSEHIEESNKREIIRIVKSYGKKIFFSNGKIIPENFKKLLCLKGGWPIATYYKWFFLNCFKIEDRILYLDCDTIINKNLSKIYNSDFEGNIFIGTVDDKITQYHREKKYGIKNYINAGVYLVNIDLFKKINMYYYVDKVNKKYGEVDYMDQDYMNIIFNNKIKIIEELQCICAWIREKYKLSNYYILHTVRKPNEGGVGFCQKRIETIFENYLKKTKRKGYIGYKKKINIIGYGGYVYTYISTFIIYISLIIFGQKIGCKTNQFFSSMGKKIGKIARFFLS